MLEVRLYSHDQSMEMVELFYLSVHNIDSSVYSDAQKEAWAPTPINYQKWSQRFEENPPFVAIKHKCIAGFIGLDEKGYIDFVYTHPEYQRQGVASALLIHVLKKACIMRLKCVFVDASRVAKPFFLRHGFSVITKNVVNIDNVALENFTMEMNLVS